MAQQRPGTSQFVPLSDANDLHVAPGNEDIRGWEVRSQDGRKAGEVKDLLIDRDAMKARYIDVKLDKKLAGGDRRVLIPVGAARLAEDDDVVLVNLTSDALTKSPAYDGREVTRDFEASVRAAYAGAFGTAGAPRSVDEERFYNERGLFGSRRPSAEGAEEVRVTRSEEELAIGKRRVAAGEAYVRKTVETEHVSQPVTRMREEVTVERRPVDSRQAGNVEIGEAEIRVPVTEEEVVVEKRPVVKEEIVVKKRAVEEPQTVDADVRRERVDVDDSTVRARGAQADRSGGDKSLGGKLADKLDDVKDRVDGNPASKPGPDATDRR